MIINLVEWAPASGWGSVVLSTAVVPESSVAYGVAGLAENDNIVYQKTATKSGGGSAAVIIDDEGTPIVEGEPGDYTFDFALIHESTGLRYNADTFTVTIADTVAPAITLLGTPSVTVAHGDTYIDSGAIAYDAVDGDLTADIVVTGEVDENAVGSYELSYNVTDAAGNSAVEVTRTVNVTDQQAPSVPSGVVAVAVSDVSGSVSWGASSDGVGVEGYKVFVDGVEVESAAVSPYGITGLSAETEYSVTVSAYDAAGNNSAQSVASVFVTDEAFVAPAAPLTLIAVGDSLTDNASSGDIITMSSAWVWGAASSGYDYYILDDVGVAGQKVQDIYARFETDVVDKNPDVVLYCGGANNIGTADTAAEIVDVITDSLALLPSTTKIIVGYVPQRTQTIGSMTAQEVVDKTNAVNAIIANINSSVSNAYPAGPYTAYDALPLDGGDKGGTFDGLHWDCEGAYLVGGTVWAPVIAANAGSAPINNDALLNSELAGTGGNTRFGASGVIADDWRGTNGVYSISDGEQSVVISASKSALFDQLNTDISGLVGEVVQGSVDIEIIAGSLNVDQLSYRLRADTGGGAVNSYCTLYSDYFSSEISGKFRMTTQPFVIGDNTELDALLTMTTNSGGSATIKISNPKCYVMPG